MKACWGERVGGLLVKRLGVERRIYQRARGLQWPWKIEQVELDLAATRVVEDGGWSLGRSGLIR